MAIPTPEQIAVYYTNMVSYSNLIDEIVADGETDDESRDAVDRNVRHIEMMLIEDFWTTEDMTAINTSVASGKAFLGG